MILLCVEKKWKCRTLLPLYKTLFRSYYQEFKFCNFYNFPLAVSVLILCFSSINSIEMCALNKATSQK